MVVSSMGGSVVPVSWMGSWPDVFGAGKGVWKGGGLAGFSTFDRLDGGVGGMGGLDGVVALVALGSTARSQDTPLLGAEIGGRDGFGLPTGGNEGRLE